MRNAAGKVPAAKPRKVSTMPRVDVEKRDAYTVYSGVYPFKRLCVVYLQPGQTEQQLIRQESARFHERSVVIRNESQYAQQCEVEYFAPSSYGLR